MPVPVAPVLQWYSQYGRIGDTLNTFGVPAHESPDMMTIATGGDEARLMTHGADTVVQPLASVICTNTVSWKLLPQTMSVDCISPGKAFSDASSHWYIKLNPVLACSVIHILSQMK